MLASYAALRALRPPTLGTETLTMRAAARKLRGSEAQDLPLVFPDYQRGHVWTDEQTGQFVGFMLEWGNPPPVFVQRWEDTTRLDEVIDGKQRLTAVARFVTWEIPAIFSDGTKAYLYEFSAEDQRTLIGPGGPTLTIQYVGYRTRAEVLRFYVSLNTGGTPHAREEIERVRGLLADECSR